MSESMIEAAGEEANAATEAQAQETIQQEIQSEAAAPAIERPEWLQDRYLAGDKGIEEAIREQAKGYAEVRKQLGGFTGAPEGEYEFSLPEGIEGEIDTELNAFKEFNQIARDVNMSNETAQKLFEVFVGYQQQMANELATDMQQQKEMLGVNADARLASISGWGMNNLSQEHMDAFGSMLTNAAQVEVMEAIIGKTRGTQMHQTAETAHIPAFTESDFKAAVMSERYRTDPDYRREVLRKAENIMPG